MSFLLPPCNSKHFIRRKGKERERKSKFACKAACRMSRGISTDIQNRQWNWNFDKVIPDKKKMRFRVIWHARARYRATAFMRPTYIHCYVNKHREFMPNFHNEDGAHIKLSSPAIFIKNLRRSQSLQTSRLCLRFTRFWKTEMRYRFRRDSRFEAVLHEDSTPFSNHPLPVTMVSDSAIV